MKYVYGNVSTQIGGLSAMCWKTDRPFCDYRLLTKRLLLVEYTDGLVMVFDASGPRDIHADYRLFINVSATSLRSRLIASLPDDTLAFGTVDARNDTQVHLFHATGYRIGQTTHTMCDWLGNFGRLFIGSSPASLHMWTSYGRHVFTYPLPESKKIRFLNRQPNVMTILTGPLGGGVYDHAIQLELSDETDNGPAIKVSETKIHDGMHE
ncbi:hypothetical protein LTS17_012308 [Exophiala oligosperma]|nr:hypothetical protein LTS06_011654 [Exophiala xenobiotica]KAK5344347.1 hypothetical protein LTR61_011882 [Exophiala xenobiotica]KAK5431505.1 hypothetical protein LTR18_011299 [Exophiala xenobiotica]